MIFIKNNFNLNYDSLFRKKKAYVCSHKRVWSNCQQADVEKQQCGFDGITESVCKIYPNNSRFESGQWQTFFSNAVMCLGVVTIPNQWFNVSFQLDHQLRIIKINLQVVVWPLLALFSSHYFSFVSHLLVFWFMLGDTVLALV